ncbi:MAG TPA: glycosyltransferase [Candidatus Saccharimonadia bacterium]
MASRPKTSKLRIGLVVPHIFMHRDILPRVIFSPAVLALGLAAELEKLGAEVVLYTPGPVDTPVRNVTADLSGFEAELAARDDDYLDLLKKHPLTFITLARQVQAELVARAYADANAGRLDVVHVYTNEEELGLVTAEFCRRPVVFTHHDPFNFLVRYRALMPRYAGRNWISISMAQRVGMPAETNWAANIYHGLDPAAYSPVAEPADDYVLYLGRIVEPKGVHLAIGAVRAYNSRQISDRLRLKIAGKHYSGGKDAYWQERIVPELDDHEVEYVGFVDDLAAKRELLANARALIIPSTFAEPFGLVQLEALACGTPVVGLDNGAIGEVVQDGVTGFVVPDADGLPTALARVGGLDRAACRADFEVRFTAGRMAEEHLAAYRRLI